jgi:hypothetical protein
MARLVLIFGILVVVATAALLVARAAATGGAALQREIAAMGGQSVRWIGFAVLILTIAAVSVNAVGLSASLAPGTG